MENIFYCLNITPLRRELHWLSVKARIDFKILVITPKILQGSAPSCVKKIISIMPASHYHWGYKIDSNAAAHFGDTDISWADAVIHLRKKMT